MILAVIGSTEGKVLGSIIFTETAIESKSEWSMLIHTCFICPSRVSAKWRCLLIKVFEVSHFTVNIPKLQRIVRVPFSTTQHYAIDDLVQASVQEWFNGRQKGAGVVRNIFFHGTSMCVFELEFIVSIT